MYKRLLIAIPIGVLLAVALTSFLSTDLPALDQAMWASYEYTGPGEAQALFVPTTDEGVVVTDAGWTIDWPEDPDSILALMSDPGWAGHGPLDLTDAKVTITMHGEGLELHGAYVTFWIVSEGRWHLREPMTVTEDDRTWVLSLGGSWQKSWTRRPEPLADALRSVDLYGLAFVGFSEEVTGRLVVSRFDLSR